MKRYDSFKDSEHNWLGMIPTDWNLIPFHIVLFEHKEKYSSTSDDLKLLTLSGEKGISYKKFEYEVQERSDTELENYNVVRDGCLVMNPLVNPLKLDYFGFSYSKIEGVVSPVYFVFNTNENQKYLEWYFKSHYTIQNLLSNTKGIRPLSLQLSREVLSGIKILIPPLSEQQQIVSFLDSKTSQIDELIQKKERKIELLKEYRTSLINQVVTKGLNPNVEMKDSGVEWIGEIPCHWKKSYVRFLTQEHRQGYYSSEPYSEHGLRVVRISDLEDDRTISIENSPFYQLSEIEKERFILKNGDFLFPRTGGVGRFGIYNDKTPSIYGSFLIRFRFSEKVLNQYMRYYFDSEIYLNQILSEIHGGVNQNVHVENIKNCMVFCSSITEQEQIVEYLDEQTQKINSSIRTEERKIELLKEYRQSLISSVVTGKIDVRTN